jgi:NhaP-type Na+/H+ or K+/H+ antiporter
VAVSALLAEVGAPPRLVVHISGESLLNDGSAIVFYSIFSQMFFYELGVEGLGETFTFGSGLAKFVRMSLGGMAIGMLFCLMLWCVLFALNRRLNREESVYQVVATLTAAYLCYYTADVVWGTSGVM